MRKGHQPVDQTLDVPQVIGGEAVTQGVELAGEFEAAVGQFFGVFAVLSGAQVGGNDEDRLIVAVAGVIQPPLEIADLADVG